MPRGATGARGTGAPAGLAGTGWPSRWRPTRRRDDSPSAVAAADADRATASSGRAIAASLPAAYHLDSILSRLRAALPGRVRRFCAVARRESRLNASNQCASPHVRPDAHIDDQWHAQRVHGLHLLAHPVEKPGPAPPRPRTPARRARSAAAGPLASWSRSPASTRIMASFRMSAAEPWMGVLRATRSAWARSCGRRDRISGIGRRRPSRVVPPRSVARLGDGPLHVGADPRVAFEVARDVGLGGGPRDAQHLGQPEVGLPEHQPEVDRLGDAPLLGGDRVRAAR